MEIEIYSPDWNFLLLNYVQFKWKSIFQSVELFPVRMEKEINFPVQGMSVNPSQCGTCLLIHFQFECKRKSTSQSVEIFPVRMEKEIYSPEWDLSVIIFCPVQMEMEIYFPARDLSVNPSVRMEK